MAVTNEQVFNWLQANPTATDAEIAQAAAAAGVSTQQLSEVTGVPVAQIEARVAAAAPTVQLPPAAPAPTLFSAPAVAPASAPVPANTWNYDEYVKALKTGGNLNEQVQRLATQDPNLAAAASNLFGEITAQQQAGTSDFWYQGNTASKEAAAADFALRLAENGITSLSQLGQVTIPGDGENLMDQQVTINKATGQPLPRPELLGRGTRGLDIDYNLAFAADGTAIPFTSNRESSWMQFRENALKPAAAFALSTIGAPLIGATVAPSLSLATQGAIGGAIAGAGSAALTDGNVLQGALLGGAGGYLQGSAAQAAQRDSLYSLANGPRNLDYMGGGQGLTSTGAANLPSMGGAQGLQILAGVPSTTLAEALSTFGGVNPSVLEGMGLGSGITYLTPSGLVTANGTIIGNDVISELGRNTGFNLTEFLNQNVGVGIGDTLANVDTGVNTGVNTGLFTGAGTVTPTTTTATTTTPPTTNLPSITPGVAGSLVKAGLGLLGTGAVANVVGGGTPSTPLQAPTQGMPQFTPEYYQQLQQYYNSYLPQTPRDVVTPLQQWYNSSYGA